MSYRVELSPAAQRQLRRIPQSDLLSIHDSLRSLVDDPRPVGSSKLRGFTAVWRVRVGQYRVIYEIYDGERSLMVLRIARRDERTYRRL